jgi:hypothetical protein
MGGVRKVGRNPKVYEPADADIQISIPQRHHDILAEILVNAVLTRGDAEQAAMRVAEARGHTEGEAERTRTRPGRLGTERALTMAATVLERHGFEPDRPAPPESACGTAPSTHWQPRYRP